MRIAFSAALAASLLTAFPAAAPLPETAPSSSSAPGLPEKVMSFDAGAGIRIYLSENNALFLEVMRQDGDTLESIAGKVMSDPARWELLKAFNPEPAPGGTGGKRYVRVPYEELQDSFKLLTMARLFPEDSLEGEFWLHKTGKGKIPMPSESLWHLALWFTGDGRNFQALAEVNSLRNLSPVPGQIVQIPRALLLPVFAAPANTEEGELKFDRDEQGDYAAYRLKKGEAIYSAVVIRFTGLLEAGEVNEMATTVAKRSGIEDVRSLAVGFEVKIPREFVLPEYLPRGDPRRIEYDLSRREVARFKNQAVSRGLEGVTVILDSGHGGRDIGAAHNGIWESDYVYDILCRVKARLEKETAAQILTTLKDTQYGFRIFNSRKIPLNQSEMILTSPPLHLASSVPNGVGVNLRWYLANSYYRSLTRKGVDPEKVVFVSIHADSLHPSLRGSMIYVPGEQYRKKTYGFSGSAYRARKEVREQPYITFSKEDRQRSEGLSREFASHVMKALGQRGARVAPYEPVRDRIIRKHRPWVPAVLRCNQTLVQVLLEACNINNPADANLLAEPSFRQKVADAFVDALLSYYA
jgi:N-acetylmuramoyl-L-alanine amidase